MGRRYSCGRCIGGHIDECIIILGPNNLIGGLDEIRHRRPAYVAGTCLRSWRCFENTVGNDGRFFHGVGVVDDALRKSDVVIRNDPSPRDLTPNAPGRLWGVAPPMFLLCAGLARLRW